MFAEFTDGPNLSESTRETIKSIMFGLEKLAELIKEPLDPKALSLLEITYDLMEEQLIADKIYKWESAKNTNPFSSPTPDELDSWLNGGL